MEHVAENLSQILPHFFIMNSFHTVDGCIRASVISHAWYSTCESACVERSETKRESKCLFGATASIFPTALVCPFRNVTGPGTPQEAG